MGSPGALPGALNTDGSKTSAKSTPADGDADSIAEGPLEAIHHHTDTAVQRYVYSHLRGRIANGMPAVCSK